MDSKVIRSMSHFRRWSDRESGGATTVGGFSKSKPDWRREYVREMSRRTKARAARLYNEFNAAAFDVCGSVGDGIESEETDESGKPALRGIGVVFSDFVIVVVAVGIEAVFRRRGAGVMYFTCNVYVTPAISFPGGKLQCKYRLEIGIRTMRSPTAERTLGSDSISTFKANAPRLLSQIQASHPSL